MLIESFNSVSAITREARGNMDRVPKGRAPVPVDVTIHRKQPRLIQLLFP